MLANLESDFPDIAFESVGLGDAIFAELDKQIQGDKEESTRILLDVANEKLNEAGFDAGKFTELDPANPRAFLNQFRAIRRDVVDASLTGRDQLRLTDSDVRGISTQATVTPSEKGVSVQQKKPRPILRKAKPTRKSDFVVQVPGKKKTAEGTVDVTNSETVDAVALTNKMLTKLGVEGRRSPAVIADAFFNGLAALGQRGIEINTDIIAPETVVSSFGGRDTTFGEIMKTGGARIRARINSFQAEERRLKDRIVQIQRDLSRSDIDPEVKRRMRFIQRKLKRRIDKIPVEAAALQDAFNDAALNVRKLKGTLEQFQEQRLLAAEDQDHEFIAQLAVEAEELAKFLQEGGFNTLGVEQLLDISKDMDELVEIARTERRRVKEAKAPVGSREEGGEFAIRSEAVQLEWEIKARDAESTGFVRGLGKDKPEKVAKTLKTRGDEILKSLGLTDRAQIFTGESALEKMREIGAEEEIARMQKGALLGKIFIPKGGPKAGPAIIVVNPWLTNEKFALETLAHEIGHLILWTKLDPNSADMQAIRADYEKWIETTAALGPDTSAVAIKASRSGAAYARDALATTIGEEPLKFSELTPNQKAYALSFDEWFADQVSKFFTDQPTPSKGLRGLQGIFKQIADSVKEA